MYKIPNLNGNRVPINYLVGNRCYVLFEDNDITPPNSRFCAQIKHLVKHFKICQTKKTVAFSVFYVLVARSKSMNTNPEI